MPKDEKLVNCKFNKPQRYLLKWFCLYFTPATLKWPSLEEWVEERLWCHSLNNNKRFIVVNKRFTVVVNKRVIVVVESIYITSKLSLTSKLTPWRQSWLLDSYFLHLATLMECSKIQTSHVKYNLSFNKFQNETLLDY